MHITIYPNKKKYNHTKKNNKNLLYIKLKKKNILY